MPCDVSHAWKKTYNADEIKQKKDQAVDIK